MVTEQIVRDAFFKASEDRKEKPVVVEFQDNLDDNCKLIADVINSGKTGEYVKYIQLKRKNANGKWRDIDAPTFFTLVMQHVWIMLVKPLYMAKETGIARNCIEGRGICSEDIDKGLLRPMRRLFYDMRQYSHLLCIDERKCYEHTTVKAYRKGMKAIGASRELIDFGEAVGFVRGILPIGTPTSPLMHHIAVYPFDVWLNDNYPHALRYADNVFVPIASLEEGHRAMWRIKMNWWYEVGVRSKSTEQRVVAINDIFVDICGFRLCRYTPRKDNHGKGLTKIRKSIWHNAIHAETKESWASYFGILSHADCYRSLKNKCKEMKLEELTSRCKLKRAMDAIEYDPKEVLEIESFDIIDYEILQDKKSHEDNWINLFCGIRKEGSRRLKAFAFHGNMKCIYQGFVCSKKSSATGRFCPLRAQGLSNVGATSLMEQRKWSRKSTQWNTTTIII